MKTAAMIRNEKLRIEAARLLSRQNLTSLYDLSLLDLRRIRLGGRAVLTPYSHYEKETGEKLPSSLMSLDGCTVRGGALPLILYRDEKVSRRRVNWTIAHELGHVLLDHPDDCEEKQREADAFAACLLMPEALIDRLEERKGRRLTLSEMKDLFPVSEEACKRRREELTLRDLSGDPAELTSYCCREEELLTERLLATLPSGQSEEDIVEQYVLLSIPEEK